jgi:hypothetical protein
MIKSYEGRSGGERVDEELLLRRKYFRTLSTSSPKIVTPGAAGREESVEDEQEPVGGRDRPEGGLRRSERVKIFSGEGKLFIERFC